MYKRQVQITANVVGQDADNPNGDGSGEVEFTVTADNAISYKFVNGDAETVKADGKITYTFTSLGVNSYTFLQLQWVQVGLLHPKISL